MKSCMNSVINKACNSKDSTNHSTTKEVFHIKESLVNVISQEADALQILVKHMPEEAVLLVQHMVATSGKVVFSGVGKSGLVAQKIAATCSSVGIPSFFLHPQDAIHGDLGAISKEDLFIVLSKSATGEDFEYILPIVKTLGVVTALVCCGRGKLVEKADLVITLPFEEEACTLKLAPTSSSTLMMAFGDAFAIAASKLKGFSKHDFARNHPAGALGKKLLLTVGSFMHQKLELPLILPQTAFKDLLVTITSKKLGLGILVDEDFHLQGIITDGDLRRACELGPAVFNKKAADLATRDPKSVTVDTLAYVALEIMEDFNITALVVVDHGKVVGLVHIHDLIKAGIRG